MLVMNRLLYSSRAVIIFVLGHLGCLQQLFRSRFRDLVSHSFQSFLISGSERELRQPETGEPEEEAERAADQREHGKLVGHDHLHRLQDIRRLVEDVDGRRVGHLPRRVDLRVQLVARGSIGKYEL